MKQNIFQRSDFSKNSHAKDEIRQKMKAAEYKITAMPARQQLGDDDLADVAAAGYAVDESKPREKASQENGFSGSIEPSGKLFF